MTERPPAYLVWNKSKWYVQCEIPAKQREFFGGRRQLKISTGTSDKRTAQKRQHAKAQELYEKLDDAQGSSLDAQLLDLIRDSKAEELVDVVDHIGEMNEALWRLLEAAVVTKEVTLRQDHVHRNYANPKAPQYDYPLSAKLRELKNRSIGALTLQELVDQFLATAPYPVKKTEQDARTSLQQFIEAAGDVPASTLNATDAYAWAEELGSDYANKTIRKKVSYLSRAMSWGEKKGLIDGNPFRGLDLSGYGSERESYRPLTRSELEQLFALEMPESHRLLLEILATTGMRLDEAATLDWEDVKEEDGIVFFDLTDGTKRIKNRGSRRIIPVPEVLLPKLPTGNVGRIFPEFPIDADGKAQGTASPALMKHIREVTDDPLKVVHSLRGTLKDKLRDTGVSTETNDFITGHGRGDAAGKYGIGPSLEVRKEALDRPDWKSILMAE